MKRLQTASRVYSIKQAHHGCHHVKTVLKNSPNGFIKRTRNIWDPNHHRCPSLTVTKPLLKLRNLSSLQLHQARRNLLRYPNNNSSNQPHNNPPPPPHQLADHRQSNCHLLPLSQQSHRHTTYSFRIPWPRSRRNLPYSRLQRSPCRRLGATSKHRCTCRTRCTPHSRCRPRSRNASYPYKSNSHPSRRRLQHQVLHRLRTTVQDHSTTPFSRHLQLVIQVNTVVLQHLPRCSPTQTTSSTRAITTSTTHQPLLSSIPCTSSITSTIHSNRHRCNSISK